MFAKNVGGLDRTIRGIVGLLLLAAYFMGIASGLWSWVALIFGIVLVATAALGWCPPYSLLGISTCSAKKA